MFRLALTATAIALFALSTAADDKKPTVNINGSNGDAKLAKEAPANSVIASQKAWDALVKAWSIKDAPKVDFDKELLVVGTTVGSRISMNTKLDEKGDLKIAGISTADFGEGFRYVIKSVSKEGVKTVNGKELPKE